MTPPAAPAAHADPLTLDATAAFRADLAAQDSARPPAITAEDHPGLRADAPPASPAPAAAPGVWLLLVTSLERATQLSVRQRPAHFRCAGAVWDEAASVLAQPRYSAIANRLGRWRSSDPTLPLFKELLWALEQPEAAGYTRLALAGYSALARLVPADDPRRGYVLAQSARALRTLGDVEGALERYRVSERLGAKYRDRWLRVRSALGLAATHHHSGNYPETRTVLGRILRAGAPDPRITAAAHHGMVLGAMVAEDWDAALAHGWHLLRAAKRGAVPRIDVLLLMAAVCRRIGRFRAALSAAEAALKICVRPDDPMLAHKIIADIALDTDDRALALTHAATLRALLHTGAGPYEDARAFHVIGLVEERWGSATQARADIEQAYALAGAYGYHELEFKIDPVRERLSAGRPARAIPTASGQPRRDESEAGGKIPLSAHSRRIVSRLAEIDEVEAMLAIAG